MELWKWGVYMLEDIGCGWVAGLFNKAETWPSLILRKPQSSQLGRFNSLASL